MVWVKVGVGGGGPRQWLPGNERLVWRESVAGDEAGQEPGLGLTGPHGCWGLGHVPEQRGTSEDFSRDCAGVTTSVVLDTGRLQKH